LVQTKDENTNDELGINLAQTSNKVRSHKRFSKMATHELVTLLQLTEEDEKI
jgi:hypothetical protein